jgi:carbamoyl-phosphate synthase small subunit
LLALANGTHFIGHAVGAPGHTVGEVVFNTSLTGYQEILTDPSYCQQIVTLTYPHIGSYGVNEEDIEAARVHAAGLVMRDLPIRASNFRSTRDLGAYLRGEGVVAIAGIDTRRLTRVLRSDGAQNGCIVAFEPGTVVGEAEIAQAVRRAQAVPSMNGLDLASVVSVNEPYVWTQTEWTLGSGYGQQRSPRHHVVAYDLGAKFNILRILASRGCKVTVVPARTSAAEALALQPDGIFLSNGPGDPQACTEAIAATRQVIEAAIPTLGICLGYQILALASGASTFKMKFGHHGANHPVKDLDSGRVSITSQNHGFASIRPRCRPTCAQPTFRCSTARCKGCSAPTARPSAFRGIPRRRPAPATSATCSTASRR